MTWSWSRGLPSAANQPPGPRSRTLPPAGRSRPQPARRDDHVPLDVLSREVARMVREGVSGWVCAADHQAYRLLRDLRELGVRVPEECSVTGYDGDPVPEGLRQLTTIKMPFRDIGVSSVVSLLRKIDHPTAPRRHILVSGREIYGETTGPAPRS